MIKFLLYNSFYIGIDIYRNPTQKRNKKTMLKRKDRFKTTFCSFIDFLCSFIKIKISICNSEKCSGFIYYTNPIQFIGE